jgi:hypothetical protein
MSGKKRSNLYFFFRSVCEHLDLFVGVVWVKKRPSRLFWKILKRKKRERRRTSATFNRLVEGFGPQAHWDRKHRELRQKQLESYIYDSLNDSLSGQKPLGN